MAGAPVVSTETTARSPSRSVPVTSPVAVRPSAKTTVTWSPRTLWAFVRTLPSAMTTPDPWPQPPPMPTTDGPALVATDPTASSSSCSTPIFASSLVTCNEQVTMIRWCMPRLADRGRSGSPGYHERDERSRDASCCGGGPGGRPLDDAAGGGAARGAAAVQRPHRGAPGDRAQHPVPAPEAPGEGVPRRRRGLLAAAAALRLPPQRGGAGPRGRPAAAGCLGGQALGGRGRPPRGVRHADGAAVGLPDLRGHDRRRRAAAPGHLNRRRQGL